MYFICVREEKDLNALYGGACGYYRDRDDAVFAVHKNVTDIHEAVYTYAVIEQLEPGLFPTPKKREWFGWDEEKEGFYEIESPESDRLFPSGFSLALGAVGDKSPEYSETSAAADKSTSCYFITAMNSEDGKILRRCGFFCDRDAAFKAVLENRGDIHSGKYDVAFLECIQQDVLAWSDECVWFKWDGEKGCYRESSVPDIFANRPKPPYYPITFF